MGSLSYSRPEPDKDKAGNAHDASGLGAMTKLVEWMGSGVKLDSDSRGFWLLYELLTGSLTIRILMDDTPHAFGSLLLRLAGRSGADSELLPLLRLLEVCIIAYNTVHVLQNSTSVL